MSYSKADHFLCLLKSEFDWMQSVLDDNHEAALYFPATDITMIPLRTIAGHPDLIVFRGICNDKPLCIVQGADAGAVMVKPVTRPDKEKAKAPLGYQPPSLHQSDRQKE